MTITVTENQLKLVLHKLDTVKLELLRLRSMLLPEEQLSEKEKKKLEQARKEIAEGKSTTLEELIKELGWNRLFQIIVSQRAKKSIKKLPAHYEKRVIELLLLFRENPIPAEYYDIKKLKGYTDTYRARIGTIRIIYEALWNKRQIHILVVEPREKAYT